MKKALYLLLLICGVLVAVALTRPVQDVSTTLTGPTMGTSYTVRLAAKLSDTERQTWQHRVQTLLDALDGRMSTYKPDSDVSRFNNTDSCDWFSVSHDTAFVVSAALEIARDTGGAFDITVAPLVNLWSFGPDRRPRGIPTATEIAAALAQVDYRYVETRLDPPALRKRHPDVSIDLSGIAKGYAVDQVAALLDQSSLPGGRLRGYMVEIGGEVRTKGAKWDAGAWHIGLEQPIVGQRAVQLIVQVSDCCLASSGDYRNFFEWDGTVYSHEIDPRTGWPVQHGLASVSVMAPSVMGADALATALMVLPPDDAWQLAGQLNLDAMLVVRNGGEFETRMTPGFSDTVADNMERSLP